MKSNNIKVVLGYYLVFISYWLLKLELLDYCFNNTIAKIISYIYLYFILETVSLCSLDWNSLCRPG